MLVEFTCKLTFLNLWIRRKDVGLFFSIEVYRSLLWALPINFNDDDKFVRSLTSYIDELFAYIYVPDSIIPVPFKPYTDDTAMSKSVSLSLVECGDYNATDLAKRFQSSLLGLITNSNRIENFFFC